MNYAKLADELVIKFELLEEKKVGLAHQGRRGIKLRCKAETAPADKHFEFMAIDLWEDSDARELVVWFYMPGMDQDGPAYITVEVDELGEMKTTKCEWAMRREL